MNSRSSETQKIPQCIIIHKVTVIRLSQKEQTMYFWLVKQEPSKYSWEEFLKDKETYWDGVRNYQARNNLKAMKKGDLLMCGNQYFHK